MRKIIDWIKDSNRWKHFVGGFIIGVFADSWYCALYAGSGVAGALELKDYLWGGKPDVIDFILTVAGAALGHFCKFD
jgi:hypothetical protein